MDSTQLKRIPWERKAEGYRRDETGHLLAANVLSESMTCDREAFLSLLTGIECFLKDVYCALRLEELHRDQWAFVPRSMLDKVESIFDAKAFSHDIHRLAAAIGELCPNLKSDAFYSSFLSELDVTKNWIHWRYEDPSADGRSYKSQFVDLRKDFEQICSRNFGSFQ